MTIQENRGVCNSFAYRGKYLRKRSLIIYIIILNQKLQDEGEKKAKGNERASHSVFPWAYVNHGKLTLETMNGYPGIRNMIVE